jgi:hypothetical protein
MSDNKKDKKTLFTEIHYGKWVALSADKKRILGYNEDFGSLYKELGTKEIVYTKPLDPSMNYAF